MFGAVDFGAVLEVFEEMAEALVTGIEETGVDERVDGSDSGRNG